MRPLHECLFNPKPWHSRPFPRTTAWTQEVRLQDVIGRVESGTETENDSGDTVEAGIQLSI